MNSIKRDEGEQARGCNVSMKFNFTVGGVAIAIVLAIAYLVYRYVR